MPFLDSDTCAEGGLFISARVFFPVWCHLWMDGWMKSFTINNHDVLYYMELSSEYLLQNPKDHEKDIIKINEYLLLDLLKNFLNPSQI
jgi:hypothetical protein